MRNSSANAHAHLKHDAGDRIHRICTPPHSAQDPLKGVSKPRYAVMGWRALLQPGGGFDKVPGHLLQARHHVLLGTSPFCDQQGNLLNARVAIAFEVVRLDRIGIGRRGQIDVG